MVVQSKQNLKVSLDVGCGWNPKGTVNVDLFLHRTIANREAEQQRYRNHKIYDKKHIANLVCADCHHLPFRDHTFQTVYCSHLLEHVGVDANKTCLEMLRVANGKLVLQVPAALCFSAHAKLHNKIFTRDAFHLMFKRFTRKVWWARFNWEYAIPKAHVPRNLLRRLLLHRSLFGGRIRRFTLRLPCFIPTEIVCEVWK